MNVLDEQTLKILLRESSPSDSTSSRIVFRDSEFCAVTNTHSVTVWFAVSRASQLDAFSPRHADQQKIRQWQAPLFHNAKSARLIQTPISVPGREVLSHNKDETFGSVVLYPSGVHGNSSIKAIDSVRKERVAFAVLRSDGFLVVFSDSLATEMSPLCDRIFHVILYAQVSLIASPSSVSFIPSSRGESIFITDASSDMVCEFRFDSSVLAVPRTCADASIIFWYLESGLPVSDTCRVSFRVQDGSTPVATIIGLNNNSDSHGTVKLVTGRSPRFKGSITTREIRNCICVTGECVLANSSRHFRIFRHNDFDFPLGSRSPVTDLRLLRISGQTVAVVQIDEIICFFAMEEGETLHPLPWEDICDVESFEISSYHHGGPKFHIIVKRSTGTVDLFTVDTRPGTARLEGSFSGDGFKCFSIAEPVYDSDPVTVAIVRQVTCDGPISLSIDCISVAISSGYTFQLLPGNIVQVDSRISGKSQKLHVEFAATNLTVVQGVPNVVVAGRSLIVASRDACKGFHWEVIDSGISEGCIAVSPECVFSLATASGQIARHALPDRLKDIISHSQALPVTDPFSIYIECLESLKTGVAPDTFFALPDSLIKNVEEIIFSGNDGGRSIDLPARRFLLAWFFSTAFPDRVSLTTEDIAWAGLSETQDSIVARIVGVGSVTWQSLRQTGLLLWCNEPGRIKEIAESIQKSALQEYMKSKDASILDDKVAAWLSVLGKQQLLSSLYKQHGSSCASPAHTRIAQFLGLDFSVAENAAKGIKNAFELVRQKRYGMAIAVFVLAGGWQEAVDICCRQMADVQLAIAILQVMKTRIGLDQSLLSDLLSQCWKSRIIDPATEAGDVFLQLLRDFRTKEGSNIKEILESDSRPVGTLSDALGGFGVRESRLCQESIREYCSQLIGHLKRYNKPLPSDIVLVPLTSHERAVRYFELGCPHLALRVPGFEELDPCLRWAVNSSLAR